MTYEFSSIVFDTIDQAAEAAVRAYVTADGSNADEFVRSTFEILNDQQLVDEMIDNGFDRIRDTDDGKDDFGVTITRSLSASDLRTAVASVRDGYAFA